MVFPAMESMSQTSQNFRHLLKRDQRRLDRPQFITDSAPRWGSDLSRFHGPPQKRRCALGERHHREFGRLLGPSSRAAFLCMMMAYMAL